MNLIQYYLKSTWELIHMLILKLHLESMHDQNPPIPEKLLKKIMLL